MIFYPDTNIHATQPHFTSRGSTLEWEYDIEGRDGYFLQCDPIAGVAIEARVEGAMSWTNLETTPIALTAYIGLRQKFEFRATPDAYTSDWRARIRVFAAKV